jgi:hypothetical protein
MAINWWYYKNEGARNLMPARKCPRTVAKGYGTAFAGFRFAYDSVRTLHHQQM